MSKKKRKPRAIGLTCGVGSMLIGAKQAGFEIVGNIEWRRYYHTGTFEHNFKKAFMVKSIDELDEVPKDIDLAVGHPECGNFSSLSCTVPNFRDLHHDAADLPLFAELVNKVKPRFFAMDDLPKSMIAFTMRDWAQRLPDYDLFPEWISNYYYGNVQRKRDRFWLIGALKTEKFSFVPGEAEHNNTVVSVLKGLTSKDQKSINHVHRDPTAVTPFLSLKKKGKRLKYTEVAKSFLKLAPGKNLTYIASDGDVKIKPGFYRLRGDYAHVVTGGENAFHHKTGLPLTCRERSRIQGCPDDFHFVLGDQCGVEMQKQTGKFMPIQFCKYIAQQIKAKIDGKAFKTSGVRVLKPNKYIDTAKAWYCENVGYGKLSKSACAACWRPCDRNKNVSLDVHEELVVATPPEKAGVKTASTARIHKKTSRKQKEQYSPLEVVHLDKMKKLPSNYHCDCKFCRRFLGVLIRPDGSKYSRLERWRYYSQEERRMNKGGHIAKTPLHVARYAVQKYTNEGDWVLDPTAGAGTTAVEAVTHKRNIVGVEIETVHLAKANVAVNNTHKMKAKLFKGDARQLNRYLETVGEKFKLVVNNPPYSGDESQKAIRGKSYTYNRRLKNLALLGESDEYWKTMQEIYGRCVEWMKPGGHFVVGIKDMMRNKNPFRLHELFAELLDGFPKLEFVGTVILPHFPTTLFMNTYPKMFGIPVPLYQTIIIFRKKGGKKR